MSGANVGSLDFQISVVSFGVSKVGIEREVALYCGILLSITNR